MDKDQKNVTEFMTKAGQETHTKLRIPTMEERELSARLILEETLETVKALGVSIFSESGDQIITTNDLLDIVADGEVDMVEVADGCADIDYINNGIANRCGIDLEPVKAEVHDSNMSKFIDGYANEYGKWIKGKSYRPANIARVLLEQCEGVTTSQIDTIDLIEADGGGYEMAMKASKELLELQLK